jgi:hypothetical protein
MLVKNKPSQMASMQLSRLLPSLLLLMGAAQVDKPACTDLGCALVYSRVFLCPSHGRCGRRQGMQLCMQVHRPADLL